MTWFSALVVLILAKKNHSEHISTLVFSMLQNVNTCPVDRQVFHLILAKHPGEDKVYHQVSTEAEQFQICYFYLIYSPWYLLSHITLHILSHVEYPKLVRKIVCLKRISIYLIWKLSELPLDGCVIGRWSYRTISKQSKIFQGAVTKIPIITIG